MKHGKPDPMYAKVFGVEDNLSCDGMVDIGIGIDIGNIKNKIYLPGGDKRKQSKQKSSRTRWTRPRSASIRCAKP